MHARGPLSALLAVAALSHAAPASALTAVLGASRDNTLYESSTGALSNGAGPTMFAGRTAQVSNSIRRALLHFDVASAVPAGATITGASLKLSMTQTASAADYALTLHEVLADWGEGTSDAGPSGGSGAASTAGSATWRHRFWSATNWTTAGGQFDAAASASTLVGDVADYTWSSAGMVADVQGWLNGPAGNYGWLLRGGEAAGGTAKRFDTRETPTNDTRPVLTIEYTIAVPALPASWGRVKAGYR